MRKKTILFCFSFLSITSVAIDCDYGSLGTVPFVAATGLWGVTEATRDQITKTLHNVFGDNLLAIYAVGSRVAGKKNISKSYAAVTATSDLDLILHLKDGHNYSSAMGRLYENPLLDPFRVEIHTTRSRNDLPLHSDAKGPISGSVTGYMGGASSFFQIIPKDLDLGRRTEYQAILFSPETN